MNTEKTTEDEEDLTAYARTLADAGFEVWRTPGHMGGYLTYRDPETNLWGTFQYSDSEGWQHLMPLKPSVEYGSHMYLANPAPPFTVQAARQCAQPINRNDVIGWRGNARTSRLSPTAVLIEKGEVTD